MTALTRVPSRLSVSDDFFERFFWISAALHFILFFGLTLKQIFLPTEVIVVQNALRVDLVALPDKVEAQDGPSAKSPSPVEIEKPKQKMESKTEEKKATVEKKKLDPKLKQLEALNKLKQQEALEKLTAKKSKSAGGESTPAPPKKNLNAGNQLAKGDSVTGLERIAFDDYISEIKGKVRENFSLPSWLIDQKIKCTVEVVIDGNGQITHRSLTRTSGNSTFDNAALSAVDASAPFPPVPERLTRGWGSFTIQFNFPDT